MNNAGVSAHGRFADADPDRLRPIMETNFFAAVELTRAALPLLKSGREPIVVNIGSVLGRRGCPHKSEYSASKFALTGFSEALRAELAPQGIDVLLVTAGPTDTEFFQHLLEEHGELPWGEGKPVSPERVARATVRAIELGRHEIVPSWRGWLMLTANRFFPRLVDRADGPLRLNLRRSALANCQYGMSRLPAIRGPLFSKFFPDNGLQPDSQLSARRLRYRPTPDGAPASLGSWPLVSGRVGPAF